MPVYMPTRNDPIYNGRFIRGKKRGGASSPLYTWYAPLQTPTQPDIARDGTEYYWPLDDATPNVSVVNYAGAKTLTKVGAGTLSAVTDFFNTQGKAVGFDGVNYLTGDIGGAIGTSDFYVEFYLTSINGDAGFFGVHDDVNLGIGFEVISGGQLRLLAQDGGSYKLATWSLPSGLLFSDGTRHHFLIQVDRNSDANTKVYIDGVALTSTGSTIDDWAATNFSGTKLYLGQRGIPGAATFKGELSQFKLVIGSYSGSTTAAFNKGLDVSYGTGAITYTRATAQTGKNEVYNPNEQEIQTQLAGNPVIYRPDNTLTASGLRHEDVATNLCLRSRELSNAAWVPSANLVVTANSVVGPDGITLADRLVTSAATQTLTQDTGTAVGANVGLYNGSAWLKGAAGGEKVTLTLTDTNGISTTTALLKYSDGASAAAAGLTIDWVRYYVKNTMGAGAGNVQISINVDDNGATVYCDMVQVEMNQGKAVDMPSSFIPTVAATATRNKNLVTIPNTELSDTKFTWLQMIQIIARPAELWGGIWLDAVNADTGYTSLYINSGSVLSNVYFDTAQNLGAVTFPIGTWILVGQSINIVDDEYAAIWNGTLQVAGTTAKATPTYSTAFVIGGYYDGNYPYKCNHR